jgi:DNA-binding transcriptional MerR regulator
MKAPDAFRTISEVAAELDLPQHVLRFWESRFAQVKPMKRGGGRRYYRPEDVELLRGIRLLLYAEGFTIRGVQRLLKEKGVGFVAAAGRSGSVETVAPSAEESEPFAEGAAPASAPADEDMRLSMSPARDETAAARSIVAASLGSERRRALEAALAELDEAKRILEQVR